MIDLLGLQEDDIYFIVSAIIAVLVLYFLSKSFLRHNKFAVRVKALQDRRAQLKAQIMAPRKRTQKAQHQASVDIIRTIVNKMNLLQKSQAGKINKMLINAGYRSKDAIFIFSFFQLVGPILVLIVALLLLKIDFSDVLNVKPWKWFALVASAYIGLKLPSVIVINNRNKRYYVIQKGLPDGLDLMLICSEAGLSLGATLDRVSREMEMTYPELAEELGIASIELGFLPERKRALINLAERVDMPEIRGIVNVLVQTEKYGTPITQALRALSAEFREQRMLRAEQKAARLPAIMTIPMIVFILPTLFVVVLTPAIIKLMFHM